MVSRSNHSLSFIVCSLSTELHVDLVAQAWYAPALGHDVQRDGGQAQLTPAVTHVTLDQWQALRKHTDIHTYIHTYITIITNQKLKKVKIFQKM